MVRVTQKAVTPKVIDNPPAQRLRILQCETPETSRINHFRHRSSNYQNTMLGQDLRKIVEIDLTSNCQLTRCEALKILRKFVTRSEKTCSNKLSAF